jgi:uncharacterized protein GlcG (DUF336 family)
MTYRNRHPSLPARQGVASARREWSRGGAYENSIAANNRYLEPVADYRGRANGVRAGPSMARPNYPPPLISLPEARAIIEGAIAYARETKLPMAVVVVDHAGNVVSADRMDGASLQNIRFAEGKAFASALYRQTTEELGALYKTRPDRYFGIMNMYPGKIYLVGGGVPLAVDGQLVGGVGVAGLPEGVDEKSARAGIAAWMKLRETMKK